MANRENIVIENRTARPEVIRIIVSDLRITTVRIKDVEGPLGVIVYEKVIPDRQGLRRPLLFSEMNTFLTDILIMLEKREIYRVWKSGMLNKPYVPGT